MISTVSVSIAQTDHRLSWSLSEDFFLWVPRPILCNAAIQVTLACWDLDGKKHILCGGYSYHCCFLFIIFLFFFCFSFSWSLEVISHWCKLFHVKMTINLVTVFFIWKFVHYVHLLFKHILTSYFFFLSVAFISVTVFLAFT